MLVRLRDPEATQQISRRLQMADRLSAMSGITSGVAHEVKNPLNAILMHVELARMKLGARRIRAGAPTWRPSRAKSCAWTAWSRHFSISRARSN